MKASVYIGIAFELTGLILVGVFSGQYLDDTYEMGGMGLMLCISVAFGLWLFHLYILMKKWSD